jgi:hypothetical protein
MVPYRKMLLYPLHGSRQCGTPMRSLGYPCGTSPFPQHHQCSAPVTGRARFMLRAGVGLVPGVKANSLWFCFELKFRCFVGRSVCYQLLLGIQYSIHEIIINPLCKVVVERNFFPAGVMSVSITGKELSSLYS